MAIIEEDNPATDVMVMDMLAHRVLGIEAEAIWNVMYDIDQS